MLKKKKKKSYKAAEGSVGAEGGRRPEEFENKLKGSFHDETIYLMRRPKEENQRTSRSLTFCL